MTAPMGNNGAKRYSYYYDREGRQVGMNVEVVACTSSPTLTAGTIGDTRFFYDDNENRVKLITKSGNAYYFVYDPTASIPAVVYEAAGTTTYLNVREPNGSLISREKYEDGDLVYSRTYHFDGLGSTIALTDEDGTTTDTYTYDAWGNLTSHTDPDTEDGIGLTTDNPYQYVGEFGYYTHWQEPTLKLLQLGVRYYDPVIGLFTQHGSPYAYVKNNPTNKTNPSGKGDGEKAPPKVVIGPRRFTVEDTAEVLAEIDKYRSVKTALWLEEMHGTKPAANMVTRTRFDITEYQKQQVELYMLGPHLDDDTAGDDNGVWTKYGEIDFDWYTTLMAYGGNNKYTVGPVYCVGKKIHSPNPPYKDIKEWLAVELIKQGCTHFSDLFPKDFMAEWNENLYSMIREIVLYCKEHGRSVPSALRPYIPPDLKD